eukprot:3066041-Prorocentrum_lima.AAC.1
MKWSSSGVQLYRDGTAAPLLPEHEALAYCPPALEALIFRPWSAVPLAQPCSLLNGPFRGVVRHLCL